jgi:hypothetical protein
MPFKVEWDRYAVAFDLNPGQGALWPHNSPHRIVNADTLNVSYATNHSTLQSEYRKSVYLANRYFRRRWGFPTRSVEEHGVMAYVKTNAYRMCRRVGLDRSRPSFEYRSTLVIDPDAATGVAELQVEARTDFGHN